jgi:hypothetical protein
MTPSPASLFQRTFIIRWTNDCRVAAKARGVTFGRPKKMRLDQQEMARILISEGKIDWRSC